MSKIKFSEVDEIFTCIKDAREMYEKELKKFYDKEGYDFDNFSDSQKNRHEQALKRLRNTIIAETQLDNLEKHI